MKKTFTKRIITLILVITLIDLQFPFILAFIGRDQIAEDLGRILVTEIIGVFFVYCCKSFFETKEEKKMEFKKAERQGDLTGYDDAEVIDDERENQKHDTDIICSD